MACPSISNGRSKAGSRGKTNFSSSLSRSDGEGDHSHSEWWRGFPTISLAQGERFPTAATQPAPRFRHAPGMATHYAPSTIRFANGPPPRPSGREDLEGQSAFPNTPRMNTVTFSASSASLGGVSSQFA